MSSVSCIGPGGMVAEGRAPLIFSRSFNQSP
jgi:hypothetical protein